MYFNFRFIFDRRRFVCTLSVFSVVHLSLIFFVLETMQYSLVSQFQFSSFSKKVGLCTRAFRRMAAPENTNTLSDQKWDAARNKLGQLTLLNLKEIFRKAGGKPGAMRKPELIEALLPLIESKSKESMRSARASLEPLSQDTVFPQEQASPTKTQRALVPKSALLFQQRRHKTLPSRLHSSIYTFDETDDPRFGPDPSFNRTSVVSEIEDANMDVTFLGTASCIPGITRGVSSIALRRNGDVWIFDVGEATQIQLQKSSIRASRITKIFLTHAHGDHTFGLPGLLCFMGQQKDCITRKEPVEIYAPPGMREYLVASIQLTYSRIVPNFIVHELKDPQFLHHQYAREPERFPEIQLWCEKKFGRFGQGQTILPDNRGIYTLFDQDGVTVYAAAIQHSLPCVGFVVSEHERRGGMIPENVMPLLKRNYAALQESGVEDPMILMKEFSMFKPDESYTFPDGSVVWGRDMVTEPRPGRKVVICGDTCDASALAPVAMNADLLVHEATNAHLKPFDLGTYKQTELKTIQHGHSTPQMAALFAHSINAHRLVLTHFSPRYKGDDSVDSVNIMRRIEAQARKASGFVGNRVIAAWDLLRIPVPFKNSAHSLHIQAAHAEKTGVKVDNQ